MDERPKPIRCTIQEYMFHIESIWPITLIIFIALGQAETDWELEISRSGIDVYSRYLENSGVKEIRAVTAVESSMAAIITLLNDVDVYPEWIPNSGGIKVLKRINRYEAYVHGIINVPWPLYDRDVVVRFFLSQDEETLTVTIKMEGFPDYIPPENGFVRMPVLNGYWKLTPKEKGIIDVVYQIHAEPGGLIPYWLVNSFASDTTFRIMRNMRSIVRKKKYQKAELEYIKEP